MDRPVGLCDGLNCHTPRGKLRMALLQRQRMRCLAGKQDSRRLLLRADRRFPYNPDEAHFKVQKNFAKGF